MKDLNEQQNDLSPFDEKIEKLEQKSRSLSEKIKQLRSSKKEVDDEIENLQNEKILFIVRQSKLSPQELKESMELSCMLKKSGLTGQDVRELVGVNTNVDIDNSSPVVSLGKAL